MDNPTPLLTVIIPVYNRGWVLARTLKSVAEQTLDSFNVILVDNNSTDNSLTLLKMWARNQAGTSRHVMVCSESTPGAAAARNCGLAYAETPWVLFFDSDDEMLPGHLKRAQDFILSHPDADVVGWNVEIHDIMEGRSVRRFYDRDTCWHNVVHGSFATHRYCARREIFVRAGGWNPAVRFWDDIELGARILTLNPRIYHAGPEITVIIHGSVLSITGTRYADTLPLMELPLDLIAPHLPEDMRWVCDIKRIIEAALAARQGDVEEGREVLDRLMDASPSRSCRLVLKAAYIYTLKSGRGIATLLRPLFRIRKLT